MCQGVWGSHSLVHAFARLLVRCLLESTTGLIVKYNVMRFHEILTQDNVNTIYE
jgi:hypothetical protein